MEETHVDERIAEQKGSQKKLQKEQEKLLKEIEGCKKKLKEVNKGLSVAARTQDKLWGADSKRCPGECYGSTKGS